MRFDLQKLFSSPTISSRDAWYFPIGSPNGQWVGLPSGETTLTVFPASNERWVGSDFQVPSRADSLALHPDGKLLACLLEKEILVTDRAGKVLSRCPFPTWDALAQSVVFHPSGESLLLITPSDDQRDHYKLTHLAISSCDTLAEVDLEGDPEGSPLATWVTSRNILQVEIDAGPNGYVTNFIRCYGDLVEPAFPSYDGGEGCFVSLLEDDTILQITGVKAFAISLDRSTVHKEVFFESGYQTGVRPGFWRDLFFIPLRNVRKPYDWKLIVMDRHLTERADIALPDLGEFVSFWCEGPTVLAECRKSGNSTFHGWRII